MIWLHFSWTQIRNNNMFQKSWEFTHLLLMFPWFCSQAQLIIRHLQYRQKTPGPIQVRRYFLLGNCFYTFLFIWSEFFLSLTIWYHASFYRSVKSSEEDYAIEINLNINLNGISNDSEEIEILDEPKSLVKSRSLSGNVKASMLKKLRSKLL